MNKELNTTTRIAALYQPQQYHQHYHYTITTTIPTTTTTIRTTTISPPPDIATHTTEVEYNMLHRSRSLYTGHQLAMLPSLLLCLAGDEHTHIHTET